MNVPPFVPPPVEIPKNVAQEPHRNRLRFVRRVAVLHGLSILAVATVARFVEPFFEISALAISALALLLLLSLVRWLAKGRDMEQRLSMAAFPFLLAVLGMLVRGLEAEGWPLWATGLGISAALCYTLACGRDLSFVGMFLIGIAASSPAIVAIEWARADAGNGIWLALSLNAGFLFYLVYDLASLLSRRRLGEEFGAVADLYRDVLNFLTYGVRVASHWRQHRIWSK